MSKKYEIPLWFDIALITSGSALIIWTTGYIFGGFIVGFGIMGILQRTILRKKQ